MYFFKKNPLDLFLVLQNVKDLSETYDNIVGDVLLSASVVAYLGPFILDYRQECLKEWYSMCAERNIPLSEHFSLYTTLGDPVKIRDWQIAGLPVDKSVYFSISVRLGFYQLKLLRLC